MMREARSASLHGWGKLMLLFTSMLCAIPTSRPLSDNAQPRPHQEIESSRRVRYAEAQGAFLPRPAHPLLLIPGLGGSQLKARHASTGEVEPVWLVVRQGSTMEKYFWGKWNTTTESLDDLNPDWDLFAPDDYHGLEAISVLSQTMVVDQLASASYYYYMIKAFEDIGYERGTTLFGFPYDWRQSVRNRENLEWLHQRVVSAYEAAGDEKLDVVSHSMGGLLFRSYLAVYPDAMAKYIRTWVAVGVPFHGAAGIPMSCLVEGYNLGHPLLDKSIMREFALQGPALHELLPSPFFSWQEEPTVTVRFQDRFQTYNVSEFVDLIREASSDYTLTKHGVVHDWPWSDNLWSYTLKTRRLLSSLVLAEGVKFVNIFGSDLDTPFHTTYETSIAKSQNLLGTAGGTFNAGYRSGDGTVPTQSASADGLPAADRYEVKGVEHVDLIKEESVFRRLRKHFGTNCLWDSVWDTTLGRLRLVQLGNVVLHTTDPSVSATGPGVETAGLSEPTMAVLSLEGMDVFNGKEGVVLSGLVTTTVMEDAHFALEMSWDCMSFTGELTYPFPMSYPSELLEGTRVMGNECWLWDDVEQCSVENGQGSRKCSFGYWSYECIAESCDKGHTLKKQDDGVQYCERCPIGFYKAETGSSSCLPLKKLKEGRIYHRDGVAKKEGPWTCDVGYSLNDIGVQCGECAVGKFKNVTGDIPCTKCTNAPDEGAYYTSKRVTAPDCPYSCKEGYRLNIHGGCEETKYLRGLFTGFAMTLVCVGAIVVSFLLKTRGVASLKPSYWLQSRNSWQMVPQVGGGTPTGGTFRFNVQRGKMDKGKTARPTSSGKRKALSFTTSTDPLEIGDVALSDDDGGKGEDAEKLC